MTINSADLYEGLRGKGLDLLKDHDAVTTAQAAFILGVSRNWVIKMIYAGRLEAKKIGRDYWITMVSVNAALLRRKPGQQSQDEAKK